MALHSAPTWLLCETVGRHPTLVYRELQSVAESQHDTVEFAPNPAGNSAADTQRCLRVCFSSAEAGVRIVSRCVLLSALYDVICDVKVPFNPKATAKVGKSGKEGNGSKGGSSGAVQVDAGIDELRKEAEVAVSAILRNNRDADGGDAVNTGSSGNSHDGSSAGGMQDASLVALRSFGRRGAQRLRTVEQQSQFVRPLAAIARSLCRAHGSSHRNSVLAGLVVVEVVGGGTAHLYLCSRLGEGAGGAGGRGGRHGSGAAARLGLHHRPFVGATALAPELSLLMCNFACVVRGSLVLDPYCGSGGLLLAARHHCGASAASVGGDLSRRVLAGDGPGRDLAANARQLGLEPARAPHELVAMDVSRPAWRNCLPRPNADTRRRATRVDSMGAERDNDVNVGAVPGMFDAIICDAPYGVREHIGAAGATGTTQQKQAIPMPADLMTLGGAVLRPGGRLVALVVRHANDAASGTGHKPGAPSGGNAEAALELLWKEPVAVSAKAAAKRKAPGGESVSDRWWREIRVYARRQPGPNSALLARPLKFVPSAAPVAPPGLRVPGARWHPDRATPWAHARTPRKAADLDVWRAAWLGDNVALRTYLDAGGPPDACNANDGRTPLMLACGYGRHDATLTLLAYGADAPSPRRAVDTDGSGYMHAGTALCAASARGHVACVEALLCEYGRRAMQKDHLVGGDRGDVGAGESAREGETLGVLPLLYFAPLLAQALYQASSFSSQGHAQCVKVLWRAGAGHACYGQRNHCASPGALSPLHRAAERGAFEPAEALLQCACEQVMGDITTDTVLRSVDSGGRRALHWACRGGHVNVAQLLHKWRRNSCNAGDDDNGSEGDDVNHVDSFGETALHAAARYGRMDAIRWLLDPAQGGAASVSVRSTFGERPVDCLVLPPPDIMDSTCLAEHGELHAQLK